MNESNFAYLNLLLRDFAFLLFLALDGFLQEKLYLFK
jgi:hypothetical protein